jgi:hypothetical protein
MVGAPACQPQTQPGIARIVPENPEILEESRDLVYGNKCTVGLFRPRSLTPEPTPPARIPRAGLCFGTPKSPTF